MTKAKSKTRRKHQKEIIINRMYQVSNLKNLNPTMPNTEIAQMVGCDESTIRQDLMRLREIGVDWGNDMAQGGFMFECKKNMARLEIVLQNWEKRIKKSIEKNPDKPDDRLMTKFANLVVLKTQVEDNVPMYHKFSHYARLIEEGKVTPQMLQSAQVSKVSTGVTAQLT